MKRENHPAAIFLGVVALMIVWAAVAAIHANIVHGPPAMARYVMKDWTTVIRAWSRARGTPPSALWVVVKQCARPGSEVRWQDEPDFCRDFNWNPVLTDPWGSPYRYSVTLDGRDVFVYIASNGLDGIAGTDDDIEVSDRFVIGVAP